MATAVMAEVSSAALLTDMAAVGKALAEAETPVLEAKVGAAVVSVDVFLLTGITVMGKAMAVVEIPVPEAKVGMAEISAVVLLTGMVVMAEALAEGESLGVEAMPGLAEGLVVAEAMVGKEVMVAVALDILGVGTVAADGDVITKNV